MHFHRMNVLSRIALLFVLAFSMTACATKTQEEIDKERRKNMTPEERENDIALQRAKERFKDDSPLPTMPQERRSVKRKTEKKGSLFNFTPHSKEKRQQMYDMSRPVLMEDSSSNSVFFWKTEENANRSQDLHESHLDRLR